ncbi:hypothetical protein NHH88_00090 [Oxalobacteraceae bacterium OTU3CAMAD1]|nr:hypothetical protein NHH88_00090 [Oxalobacteraceae bacterium OTU3CAMAD1]
MQIPTLENSLKRAAPGSVVGYGLTAMLSFIALDTAGRPTGLIFEFFVSAAIISAIVYAAGVFFIVRRVKFFYLILGVFGFLPLLVLFISPAVLTTMIVDEPSAWKAAYWASYSSVAIFLSWRSIRKTKALESRYKYLESEIKLDGSQAYVDRREMKYLWELAPRKELGSRLNKILGTALLFLPSLYPLQIILFRMDENLHLLVHLSVLCLPLSLYAIVQLCSGYYLWVHLVGRFEMRVGLPVVFRGLL